MLLFASLKFKVVQEILDGLLREQIVQDAALLDTKPTKIMRQVRYLVLRNKADIISRSDETATEALRLYQEALTIDDKDASLLSRTGILVRHLQLCLAAAWGRDMLQTLCSVSGLHRTVQ